MRNLLCIFVSLTLLLSSGATTAQTSNPDDLLDKALTLSTTGDRKSLEEGRTLIKQAKAVSAAKGDQKMEMAAARMLALSLNNDGRHEESKKAAEEMLETARRLKSPFWEASALAALGFAEMRMHNLEAAFLQAQQAYQMHSEQAWKNDALLLQPALPTERAFTCFVLGIVHNLMGQPRQAMTFLNEGLTYTGQAPTVSGHYKRDLGIARLVLSREIANSLMRLGDIRRAIGILDNAIRRNPEDLGMPIATLHGMLAEALTQVREFEPAELHAKRSLEIAERVGERQMMAEANTRLGRISAMRGDDKSAEAYFKKGARADAIGHRGLTGLGDVYGRRGNIKQALEQYEKAIDVVENRIIKPDASDAERFQIFQATMTPYVKAVDAMLRLHFRSPQPETEYAQRAFQADQRIRNRMFAQQLASAWTESKRTPEEFDSDIAAVERQLNNVSKTLVTNKLSRGQRDTLARTLDRLELQQSVLKRKVAIYNKVDEHSRDFEELSMARIQELLPANTALIEYNVGGLPAMFVLTKDALNVVRLQMERPGQLPRRIGTYFDLLSKASSDPFDGFGTAGGYKLYKEILEPAVQSLPPTVSHLIISPAPPMETLPFEALPTSGTGNFLVEKYSVSYLPSASALPILLEKGKSTYGRQLLAFADPAYPDSTNVAATRGLFDDEGLELNSLPYTRVEVDSVAQIVGKDQSDVFVGADANEGQLKKLDLTQYRLLHFATHAIGSRMHPERSSLVFSMKPDQSDDGLLQVREIFDLRLNADLVVLSACQTGTGNGMPGEGVHGLSKAFMFAGARSLVASMWKVEDEATSVLMTHFYNYLRAGLSKGESLRRAKIDLIHQGYSHPRQWAGFVLFGEADETLQFAPIEAAKTPALRYAYIIAIAAILAAASAALALRARKGV